jgi:hypothetical protein
MAPMAASNCSLQFNVSISIRLTTLTGDNVDNVIRQESVTDLVITLIKDIYQPSQCSNCVGDNLKGSTYPIP